jgi:CheY-like chemotaxis protein
MDELIDWLIKNEDAARQIYEEAAVIFREDKRFCELLTVLAEDEALHVRIVDLARTYLHDHSQAVTGDVLLDVETCNKINGHIRHIREMLSTGTVTKNDMLDYILCTERSEWNSLFMYVVNTLKSVSPDFPEVGPALQHHLRSIDQYIEECGYTPVAIESFRRLDPAWNEAILIAEDCEVITELLAELLSRYGEVDTALDGTTAFEKAMRRYYAVIISDINMPGMDGITFFQNLEKFYSSVADRIIFMTGYLKPEVIQFCRVRNIPLLSKPFSLSELQSRVFQILDNNIRQKPLKELVLKKE